MKLSPRDIEKLMLHNAGFLAQKRYARGVSLNYPETIALIAAQLLEFIREGASVVELMDKGKKILGIDDVMAGVPSMIHDVQIEGTFPDGTKLVTVHNPVCNINLNNGYALYGSGLSRIGDKMEIDNIVNHEPGKTYTSPGELVLNDRRSVIHLEVLNSGDRPVQVGSHYLFTETNIKLKFDRIKSIGYRLDIPAGTAVRFEPGEKKTVQLVAIANDRIVYGGNNLINGPINEKTIPVISQRLEKDGYLSLQ